MPDIKPLTGYPSVDKPRKKGRTFFQAHPLVNLFLKSIIPPLLSGIIAAVVAALIFSKISENRLRRENEKSLIRSVQSIYIGSNKEWVDSKFNPPTFSREISNYMDCTYITDIAAVRVLYEMQTYSCRAYFVTLLKNDITDTVSLPDVYTWIADDKPLGSVSYHDIVGEPSRVAGYVSNGVGYTFYAEEYPMNNSGNYYTFYFASLDYGIKESAFFYDEFSLTSQIPVVDDEVDENKVDYDHGSQIIRDRCKVKPNTYGVCSLPNTDVMDIISDYRGFDILQLREDNEGHTP